jgi:hypothetical protein
MRVPGARRIEAPTIEKGSGPNIGGPLAKFNLPSRCRKNGFAEQEPVAEVENRQFSTFDIRAAEGAPSLCRALNDLRAYRKRADPNFRKSIFERLSHSYKLLKISQIAGWRGSGQIAKYNRIRSFRDFSE